MIRKAVQAIKNMLGRGKSKTAPATSRARAFRKPTSPDEIRATEHRTPGTSRVSSSNYVR